MPDPTSQETPQRSGANACYRGDHPGFGPMKPGDKQFCSAIQSGPQRIEFHKPDLGLQYSVLAPKVAEAWAFLKAGKVPAATKALDEAKEIIDTAAMRSATVEVVGDTSR